MVDAYSTHEKVINAFAISAGKSRNKSGEPKFTLHDMGEPDRHTHVI